MRLTNDIKNYIYNRLKQLVPQPFEKSELDSLDNELEGIRESLRIKVEMAVDEAIAEIVEKYPELKGIDLRLTYRGNYVSVDTFTGNTLLNDELRKNRDARDAHLRNLNALAQIDAANCKSSEELDDMLIKLSKR